MSFPHDTDFVTISASRFWTKLFICKLCMRIWVYLFVKFCTWRRLSCLHIYCDGFWDDHYHWGTRHWNHSAETCAMPCAPQRSKEKKSKQEGSCVRAMKFFALGHFGWQNVFHEEGTNKYLEEIHWGLLSRQIAAGSGNFPSRELLEAGRALTGAALHVPARFVLTSVYCWGPSSKLGSEQVRLSCSSCSFLACGTAPAVKMGYKTVPRSNPAGSATAPRELGTSPLVPGSERRLSAWHLNDLSNTHMITREAHVLTWGSI